LIKEPFTRIEKIATVISFTGVILIARPSSFFSSPGDVPASGDGDMVPGTNVTTPIKTPSDASDYDNVTAEQRLQAVALAMLGVCGTVVAFTTIRWIGKRAHPLISVNYFAAWCTVVSFVMQFILPGVGFLLPADAKEWAYLIFLGICGFVMVRLISSITRPITNKPSSNSCSPPDFPTKSLLELRT
jgi:drug/metabolite transporter (DMT)-like permease